MNRKIILNLYKTKLKICHSHGYKLGTSTYVQPNFNLGRALVKLKKIRTKSNRAKFVMSHIKQAYNDSKDMEDEFMINAYIDEGFLTLRNFDNFLKLKKKVNNYYEYIDIDLSDY